jgi:aspartate ammonia-lyase
MAKKAFKENKTIRELAKQELDMTDAQLNEVLDVSKMTIPGASGGEG